LEKQRELDGKLAEISKLTEAEAKELFINDIKKRYAKDGASAIEKYKKGIESTKKDHAREIILRSIQQYA
jgi:hypothetical protein